MLKQHNGTEKVHTDLSVYEASKARIHFCYDNYDEVLVNCSGGKDSQLLVLLTKEVVEERGLDEKVKVVFYDQEFIYPETEKFIANLFKQEWVTGYRLCLDMGMEIANPDGSFISVTFWDKERKFFRPKPEDGIFSDNEYFDIVRGERAVRDLIFPDGGSKKICQLIGTRAQESITRLSTILASYRKGAQCFLRHSLTARGTDIGTPIYDWLEPDVWFYLKGNDILELNEMYYLEMINNRPLRVGVPINNSTIKNIADIKKKNPKYYEMLTSMFPEIDTAGRYASSLAQFNDYDKMVEKYGMSIRGIKNLLKDIIPDDEMRLFALYKFRKFVRDYIEFDRYTKYGHTRESALRVAFISYCKNNYSKNIMLRNKVETKKERVARELKEQENENSL